MNCVHCGKDVADDARFCQSCGSQVSDAEGQARASSGIDDTAVKHIEELLRQDTTGEFQIERLLGRGGMALVFLAMETRLARKVAIKVLPPELTFGHGVERFMREAKTAAKLDHPHIIPVYRIASGGKIFWYAMKYLEGRSLDDVLKERGRLPLDESINILAQVADALDYAHEHQVIHRDIKPANVMLDSRNRVIVTDFGIAKALSEGGLTASGSVVGTPYYMSPEQAMGIGVTGRSDQYSVGVMAYRMLAGKVPFEGETAIDILHKHCMVAPPPMDTIQGGLPAHVYRAVAKALEKKPEARFPSVAAFVEGLRRQTKHLEVSAEAATLVVPGAGGSTAAQGPPRPGRTPPVLPPATPPTPIPTAEAQQAFRPGRKRAPMAIGVAAAALLVGVGGWWLFLKPTPPQPVAAGAPQQQPAESISVPPVSVAAPVETTVTQQPPPVTERPAPPAPTTGRVMVVGLPPGGMVSVNGRRQAGATFELSPGTYQLQMGASGYERITTSVSLKAGERLSVAYTGRRATPVQPPPGPGPGATGGTGVIQLNVRPWANVWLDGRSLGTQSRRVDTLIAGTHVFRVEREGYATRDTTVTLREGQVMRLIVELTERP